MEAKRFVGTRYAKTDAERKQFGPERRFFYYARTIDEVVSRVETTAWAMQPDVIQLDTGEWKTSIDDQRKSGIGT